MSEELTEYKDNITKINQELEELREKLKIQDQQNKKDLIKDQEETDKIVSQTKIKVQQEIDTKIDELNKKIKEIKDKIAEQEINNPVLKNYREQYDKQEEQLNQFNLFIKVSKLGDFHKKKKNQFIQNGQPFGQSTSIAFIGPQEGGKSQLIQQFQGNQNAFDPNNDRQETGLYFSHNTQQQKTYAEFPSTDQETLAFEQNFKIQKQLEELENKLKQDKSDKSDIEIMMDDMNDPNQGPHKNEEHQKLLSTIEENKKNLKTTKSTIINEIKVTTLFMIKYALQFQFLVICIRDFSSKIEQFLNSLFELIESRDLQEKIQIIIVHNYSQITTDKEIQDRINKDIKGNYNVVGSGGYWQDFSFNTQGIKHVVLGKKGTEAGDKYNNSTFQAMNSIFDQGGKKENINYLTDFREYYEKNIKTYIEPTSVENYKDLKTKLISNKNNKTLFYCKGLYQQKEKVQFISIKSIEDQLKLETLKNIPRYVVKYQKDPVKDRIEKILVFLFISQNIEEPIFKLSHEKQSNQRILSLKTQTTDQCCDNSGPYTEENIMPQYQTKPIKRGEITSKMYLCSQDYILECPKKAEYHNQGVMKIVIDVKDYQVQENND